MLVGTFGVYGGRWSGGYEDARVIGRSAIGCQKSKLPKSNHVGTVDGSPQGAAARAASAGAGPRTAPAPTRASRPSASSDRRNGRAARKPNCLPQPPDRRCKEVPTECSFVDGAGWVVRGKDAGRVRMRSYTGATEDAASRRPARSGDTTLISSEPLCP